MVEKFRMDGHKLFWHLDRVHNWQVGKHIYPLYIDMGITQTCNIACSYCYYAVPKHRTKNMIPTDSLIKFLRDASEAGVKAMGFLGDGEPMVHPGVYDAVISGDLFGLDMAIATNGLILDYKRLEGFLSALTWIRFTIGAVDKYSKIMGTKQSNLYKVINNIKECIRIKKEHGLSVTIGLQMVLIPDSVSEVVPLAKLGEELGVDYLVVKQCSHSSGVYHGFIEDIDALEPIFVEAESYATDTYSVIIKRNKMNNKKRNYDRCYGCMFLPQITGAGDVYVCGNFFGNKKYWLGNIVEKSFRYIIDSQRYKDVMKKVAESVDVHKECGLNCRQNEINEFLFKLKQKPEHINFI